MKSWILASVVVASAATLLFLGGCGKKDTGGGAGAKGGTTAKQESPAPAPAGGAGQASEPAMIRASHILVAYKGAMRATATRTREEALARANEALAKVRAPEADFAAVAREYSDDPGSGKNGGDLGTFGKGMMVSEFETPAWNLPVGGISEIVETPFGFHVIKRTM